MPSRASWCRPQPSARTGQKGLEHDPNPRKIAGGIAAAVLGSGVTAALLLGPSADQRRDADIERGRQHRRGRRHHAESGDTAERGERLRELLQPLVDAGALTEEQADAIVAELVDSLLDPIGPDIQIGADIQVGPGGPGFPGRHEEVRATDVPDPRRAR